MIAIRGGGLILTSRKAACVVAVDVAPDEPPREMRWLREKPVQTPIVSRIPER